MKTRLAKGIGEERALQVYRKLLDHTRTVASRTDAVRQVWYDSRIDRSDEWNPPEFVRKCQTAGSLGSRMSHAFKTGFESGYAPIVIIGSDCPALEPHHLSGAFSMLESVDVVLGPSADGGYWLLGMNRFLPELFERKPWSSPELYAETIRQIEKSGFSRAELETLRDIDTADDLEASDFTDGL